MAITSRGASQTPANVTFSNLKTEIARFVKAPTSTEVLGVAGDGLNDAVRFMNTRPWEFMLDFEDHTLVASTKEYTCNANMKLPRHGELLNSSSVALKRLPYYPPKGFLAMFEDRTGTGAPVAYTILNPYNFGQLTLDRAPDASFVSTYPTLRNWYYELIQTLSADGDTLLVPAEAERVMVWKAKLYVAELYGNAQLVQIARVNFVEAYTELKKQHRRDDTDWPVGARR